MAQTTLRAKIGVLLCSCFLLAGILFGCGSFSQDSSEGQSEDRQYLIQVNQIMDDLSSKLDTFDDAVARGDTVTMRTQADNAFTSFDQLSNLHAPDNLANIQQQYVSGCDSLRNALSAYVDLYTEIATATEEHPFDYASYTSRLAEIQQQYNEGIAALQLGDSQAIDTQ